MTLFTFTRGNGPHQVLFLHGFLGSGRNLSSLAQRLSELRPDLTITVADLPGHGASSPMTPPYALPSLVEPVRAFVQTLVPPVTIVGHSMGGRVAIEVAAALGKHVEQVIAIDIAPGPIGDRNEDLERVAKAMLAAPERAESRAQMKEGMLAMGLTSALADWLLMNLVNDGKGALVWRTDRDALVKFGVASRTDNLWPAAERIAHKLRVAYGTRSPFVTPEDVARIEALGAHVQAFESGHYVHVDALEALAEWLSQTIVTAPK